MCTKTLLVPLMRERERERYIYIWGLSNIPLPQNHPLTVPFADLSRSFAAQGKPTKASSDDDKSIFAETHYITLSPALSPCFRGSFATTEKH